MFYTESSQQYLHNVDVRNFKLAFDMTCNTQYAGTIYVEIKFNRRRNFSIKYLIMEII